MTVAAIFPGDKTVGAEVGVAPFDEVGDCVVVPVPLLVVYVGIVLATALANP